MSASERSLEISTPRLLLIPLALADLDQLHAILTEREVRQYLLDDELVSREWVTDEINASTAWFDAHGYGTWGIRLPQTLELIGFCGFRYFYEPPELELYYGLSARYWGHGFATEAAAAVVEYAFNVLHFNQVYAATDAPNVASNRVLERLGMRLEGHRMHGDMPAVHYAISKTEFEQSR